LQSERVLLSYALTIIVAWVTNTGGGFLDMAIGFRELLLHFQYPGDA
jgi:hypothetical protein